VNFFQNSRFDQIPGNSRLRVARFPGIPEWENPVALVDAYGYALHWALLVIHD